MQQAAEKQRLRLALLLDGLRQPAWAAFALRQIVEAGDAEIVLVVLSVEQQPSVEPCFASRFADLARAGLQMLYDRQALWEQYSATDARFYQPQPDAQALVDISEYLHAVVVRHIPPLRDGQSDDFPAEEMEAIRLSRPDVLLHLGARVLRGAILRAARFGVWSLRHGDTREYRGSPALFWEMYDGNPASGAVLQVQQEEDPGGLVLYRSISQTHPYSLARNRNEVYWKSAAFAARCLRDVHRFGWNAVFAEARARERDAPVGPLLQQPTDAHLLEFLRRLRARKKEYPKRYKEHWDILVRPRSPEGYTSLASHPGGLAVPCPQDRFYADPCLWQESGRTFLFFEEYLWAARKGHISCLELLPGGGFSQVVRVLELPYHLSAPHLFRHGGELYMLPESGANITIELYRCLSFPDRWARCETLLEGVVAVDPKIVEHDGLLWLFANVAPYGGSTSDELHVYYAERLTGPWRAHARNPVVSDASRARPAGDFFRQEGALIRPAQDCTGSYGRGLCFMEVQRLTPEDYAERLLLRVAPEPFGGQGIHTYTSSGGVEAVDIKRIEPCAEPWAAQRLLDYPFVPVLWPARCYFPLLRLPERLAVMAAKFLRRLWRRLRC